MEYAQLGANRYLLYVICYWNLVIDAFITFRWMKNSIKMLFLGYRLFGNQP